MKISFDFDGTLENDFDGTPNKQKEEIQKIASEYLSQGHEVFIITKRYDESNRFEGVGNEHLIVFQLASKLGISPKNCIFTNRQWKVESIQSIGIQRHFENSDIEVKMISDIGVEVIPIEDPYWRDILY